MATFIDEAPDGELSALDNTRQSQEIGELMQALFDARQKMPEIGRSGHNKYDNYKYSTLVDYLDSLLKGANEFGLVLLGETVATDYFETTSGSMRNGVRVDVDLTLYHTQSKQWITRRAVGEAYDKGDKALYKAITGARKYGIQLLFNLMGEDDPEKDDRAPEEKETKSKKEPTKSTSKTAPKEEATKKAPAPNAEPKCPPVDTWKDRVNAAKTPKDMVATISKMAINKPLIGSKEVMVPAFDYAAQVIAERGEEYEPVAASFAKHYGDVWKDKFDACQKPSQLAAFLKVFFTVESLEVNAKLFADLFDYVFTILQTKEKDGAWGAEEVDSIKEVLRPKHQVLDTLHQGNEVFG